jgi:hypothetical protein
MSILQGSAAVLPRRRSQFDSHMLEGVQTLDRLSGLIDKFAVGGAAGCTRNPHSFFGRMTPED